MSYKAVEELPEEVRNSLPHRAQVIYLRIFNSVWENYQDPGIRRKDVTREIVAHKVACWVIEHKYRGHEPIVSGLIG